MTPQETPALLQLLEKLDGLTTAIATNAIGPDERLWSKEDIATYLGCSTSQVTQRYACLPDFPAPICLPSSGPRNAHPRWKPAEVKEWADKYQTKKRTAKKAA